jgi:hypothetical protein
MAFMLTKRLRKLMNAAQRSEQVQGARPITDVRIFLKIRPGTKERLLTAIEALVDVLDSLAPDATWKRTAKTN